MKIKRSEYNQIKEVYLLKYHSIFVKSLDYFYFCYYFPDDFLGTFFFVDIQCIIQIRNHQPFLK